MSVVETDLEVAALRRRLEEVAEPERAQPMAAYLRDQFPFFGVASKERRLAARPTLAALKATTPDELLAFASNCWDEPEREFAYVACDVLRAHAARLAPEHLFEVRALCASSSRSTTPSCRA